MEIQTMQEKAFANSFAHGFWDDEPTHSSSVAEPYDRSYIGNKIMLIVGELAEAHEEIRRDKPLYYEVDGKPEGLGPELADAVIRIGDLATRLGIDLATIIEQKMTYNASRSYKHGKTM